MKLDRDTPTAVFPIETTARELDSKLMMAAALAGKGLRAIVANKEAAWAIGRESRRVVWQGKNLFADDNAEHHADKLIRRNSAVMFLQDEGGIFQTNTWVHNVLQKHHVDQVRGRKIDRVCMWGDRQRQVFCEHTGEAARQVVVTGSPRFDLCGPDYQWLTADATKAITERVGNYILVCTRFTAIAHSAGIADPFRRKLNPRIWPDNYDMTKVSDLWFSKWRRDVHDFADFVVLIKAIANAYPSRKIVLRPHPSESVEFYTRAFEAVRNVSVVREGGVLDWIRGADLVVHSNCTTGIEAVLAGKPVLNFLPLKGQRGDTDIEVAREAGITVGTQAEALATLDELLRGAAAPHTWSSEAIGVLNNLKEPAVPILVQQTLSVLAEDKIDTSEVTIPAPSFKSMVKRALGRSEASAYVASKRGPLNPDYVERVVDGARAMGWKGKVTDMGRQHVVIEPA